MNYFGIVYLFLIPLIYFSSVNYFMLSASLLIGVLLFILFKNPSLKYLISLLSVVILLIIILRPTLGLDFNYITLINAQRGEHANFQNNLLSKIIHNKIELLHSFILNIDNTLSLKAIFASGYWKDISKYYPLGYLFPWDIFFLINYLKKYIHGKQVSSKNLLFISLFILFVLTGLLHPDQSVVFSNGVIFFVAILCSLEYNQMSRKYKILFLLLNSFYLIFQFNISQLFKL